MLASPLVYDQTSILAGAPGFGRCHPLGVMTDPTGAGTVARAMRSALVVSTVRGLGRTGPQSHFKEAGTCVGLFILAVA